MQCDRMAADCGHELRRHNVTFVSLWPGAVMTEAVEEMLKSPGPGSLASVISDYDYMNCNHVIHRVSHVNHLMHGSRQ